MLKLIAACSLAAASAVLAAAEFLGPDRFWRPRENMMFYLNDETGGGFDLKIDLRDMNVYCEGARDAYVFVIAPDGRILVRCLLPDDGITRNEPKYKDGCADIGLDFRYRAYHRLNSENGTPPGKERSPYLAEPQKLKARTFSLKIPDAGKGIYRLAVAGCWDHWFSVTPSRRMSAALHPGQGAVYLHRDQLRDGYLYIPAGVKDASIALTGEIRPFNWRVSAEIDGKTVAEVQMKQFYHYCVLKNLPPGKVLRLKTSGDTTGAMLHVKGIPFIVFEDAATAMKIAGGVREPALKVVAQYGSEDDWSKRVRMFGNALGFGDYDGSGLTIREKENPSLWRSSWWNFGDGNGVVPRKEVPAEVKRALTDLYEKWALNRYVMELGTCTNQWGKILENMAAMYEFTKSPVILEALRYNVKRMCTKNSLGRVNPDPDSFKSGYEADSGRIDNGIMAECLGHDNEYNLETDAHMSRVYRTTKQREIVDYQTAYYRLKTHLTLSRTGGIPANIFNGTCSPTDANFRTRFYTHKTGALLDLIPYGDLWNDGNGLKKSQWPWLEKEPFSRDLEGRYRAVNTGTYYALFYTGPSYPRWQAWGAPEFNGNSMEFTGFNGMGYGGWQAYPNKSGGLCTVWVPGCGPLLLANNHNVMYGNTLWGENLAPAAKNSAPNVDSAVTADAYCDAVSGFDSVKNVFVRKGVIPDTPLHFERRITVGKTELKVEIALSAEKDFRMKCLYEAVPFFADQRKLTVDGRRMPLPAARVTPMKVVDRQTEGLAGDTMSFRASEIVLTGLSGRGAEIVFDKEYEFITSTPLRYRSIAAAMSSFNLKLPVVWKKGMEYHLSYTMKIIP